MHPIPVRPVEGRTSSGRYDFNLLVSCGWGEYAEAKREIVRHLVELGDKQPEVRKTLARGITGVRTSLDPRSVTMALRATFQKDPSLIQHTSKWTPIDLWTDSNIESIKEWVTKLRAMIGAGETWRMTVETRRYTTLHKSDIIREIAELIDEKVDLENPDKILRIEFIGKHVAISVLKPYEIFSQQNSILDGPDIRIKQVEHRF
jgi:tRNA acetyltransferase TAN1